MKEHNTKRHVGAARILPFVGAVVMALPTAASAGGAAAPQVGGGLQGMQIPANAWNHLWNDVLIDLLVIGVVFGLAAIYMLWKYRAKSPDDVGTAPKLSKAQAIGWILIPAALFMADDFYLAGNGWVLWNLQRTPPADALEIRLTGNQWYWEFDYGNGVVVDTRDEGDKGKVVVPVGRGVVMRMTAADVLHSLAIPDFRVKEDVLPGRKTFLWFVAPKEGETLFTCTEFCGTNHSQMPGYIKAVSPAEFETWLKSRSK
ncbi:COX2_CUA domain-containing protein [Azospirillaceae bacterium]